MSTAQEIATEIRRKMIERYMQEIAKILNKDEHEIQPNQNNDIEFSCEDVLKIQGKVYWIIGNEYINKIRPHEKHLKYPPIYFRDGECKEMLKSYGISNGIYLVKNGIILKTLSLADLVKH